VANSAFFIIFAVFDPSPLTLCINCSFYIIQMMHGCKWNIQICCPEVDMLSRGRRPSDDISIIITLITIIITLIALSWLTVGALAFPLLAS